jgi:hypothetical protein
MQTQGNAPAERDLPAQRPARRYATCAEAMQAVDELALLADDEVTWLRDRGREAEADRRRDAWQREINRALGEAKALQEAVARPQRLVVTALSPPAPSVSWHSSS